MKTKKPLYLNIEQTVDHIINYFDGDIKILLPLGLGKSVLLINALYRRVKKEPDKKLSIFSALSLEKPVWKSDLERRFMEPFVNRVWKDVPELEYLLDFRRGKLPDNIFIYEFYCKAGMHRNDPKIQQNYMSTNYTHTVRDAEINEIGVFSQIIAKKETANGIRYSASCNADVSLEALEAFEKAKKIGKKRLSIGMVNTELPFMHGDAQVSPSSYDIIIDEPENYLPLFVAPRQPISVPDYMIGLYVSTLIKDNGTLQIGIGSLGDAIAYCLSLRNNQNDVYNKLIRESDIFSTYGALIEQTGGTDTFEEGLYGSTEMFVDGFLQLYNNGVIKRKVYHHEGVQGLINEGRLKDRIPCDILSQMIDREMIHPYLTEKDFLALQSVGVFKQEVLYENGWIVNGKKQFSPLLVDAQNLRALSANCLGASLKNGVLLTGAFFIGPQDFYDILKDMPEEERGQFEMTGVSVANQLYGNEKLRSLQRKNGRFCNTGMKVTLLGHISSDAVEDGTVISGVGGQYNFVSMAHALPDGRLVMMIKSTRHENGKTFSNIVYSYGNVTVPRHLKDIIVTEYGIADIRGRCDQEVIKAILNITDSRFQEELLAEAKKNKKIPEDYQIPNQFRNNTPDQLRKMMSAYKSEGFFPDFPFGSAFEDVELPIAFALKTLKAKAAGPEAVKIPDILKELPTDIPNNLTPFFERMGLFKPITPEETGSYKTLMLAFKLSGFF